MTENKNTVDYTIRGVPTFIDTHLTHLSILTGKPKSVLVREKLVEVFTDPIKSFGMLNPLVAALDEVIATHLGPDTKVLPEQVDNHFGTKWNIEMREVLGIKSDADLQPILISNTPYLTVRADQVMQGYNSLPKATSLWFALFVEIAFSSPEVVKQAWKKIFYSNSGERYYQYYKHVNELRRLRHLETIEADRNDFRVQGDFCEVRLFKPEEYQYGAWRIGITLNEDVAASVAQDKSEGFRFPKLAQRLFIASPDEGYSCAVRDDQDEFEPGFRFVEGRCELDMYSNGTHEDFNRTRLSDVVDAVVGVIDERLRSLKS
jgi:hypothetical protein